jgi:Tol biopolymer transport system component
VVSLRDDGKAAGGAFLGPAVSEDARYVAYWTPTSLDPRDDTGLSNDIYVRDRTTGTNEWASSGPEWTPLYHDLIGGPLVSGDGRYVVFSTFAPTVAADGDALTDVFVRDLVTDTTELVSATPGEASYGDPDISADGRYVAFSGVETPGSGQVFLKDQESGTTSVVSVGDDGQPLPGGSGDAAISADGRHVTFVNKPTPASPPDIYVRDLDAGTTDRLTTGTGVPPPTGTWWAGSPAISGDGRYVAYLSSAADIVPRDTNLATDVFVHDREQDVTERVSVTSAGAEAASTIGPASSCLTDGGVAFDLHVPPSSAFYVSISDDGRYVSFVTLSDNLAPGDSNGCYDVFVHDRVARTTERVSVGSNGQGGPRAGFYTPAMALGGRYVGFIHFSRLAPEDINTNTDVYLRDRGPEIGVGRLDTTVSEGTLSAWGWATFSSAVLAATSDAAGDAGPGGALGGDLTGATLVYRHEPQDLLVRLSLASLPPVGGTGVAHGMRFAVGADTYEARIDAQVATLHRCTPGCTQIATLQGSLGTTGDEVLIAVPLSLVGASVGSPVSAIRAFTRVNATGQEDSAELPNGDVPATTLRLGIAPAGTPEADVELRAVAALTNETFAGTLDVSSREAGPYDVWARACLGEVCGAARRTIEVE